MRLLALALLALLWCSATATATAAPFGEVPFQPLRDDRLADCLQAAGGDRIGLVSESDDGEGSAALVRVAPDGALAIEAATPLGLALECPSIAAAASGAAVVAHGSLEARGMRLVVALREPGGALGTPLRLASRGRAAIGDVDTAIASSGAAIVAWIETGVGRHRTRRLRVIRRAPGGAFGAPQTVPVAAGPFTKPLVGIDDAGRATMAWERGNRAIDVATAAPGVAFGAPQRLGRAQVSDDMLALAIAADGGALLAHEATDGIRVFERTPGAARMTPGPSYPAPPDVQRHAPVVALAPGGGAAVAWLNVTETGASVEVALRSPGGAFQPPQVLGQALPGAPTTFEPAFRQDVLHAAVGSDGGVVLGWLERQTIAGGDAPARVAVAAGTLTGSFEPRALVGGPGRSADGLAVLAAPAAVVWTDNLPGTGFGTDNPFKSGRLHRALAGVALQDPPPPEVMLQARSQRVRGREPVVVRARCSAACDLRAVAGRDLDGDPAGFGVAQLDAAGSARIVVNTPDSLVPRGGGRLRVTVHATAPGGVRPTVARIDVRVRRRAGGST